jgi:hypothetical protein
MSKKTLLNEATVRRFMKLANMGTLSDNFVNEGAYGMHEDDEDGAMEEGGMMGGPAYQDDEDEKMDMGDMGDMDAEVPDAPGDEGPEEDEPAPEPEMDMDDMGDDADEVEISQDDRDALSAAIPVLEKIAGGAGGDMDMGDMDVEDDPGMMDKPMEEAAHMNKDEEMKKEELDEVELVDENDLVQEVTRRVAARLRAAMKSRK